MYHQGDEKNGTSLKEDFLCLGALSSYSTFKRKPLPKHYQKVIMTWEILKQINS